MVYFILETRDSQIVEFAAKDLILQSEWRPRSLSYKLNISVQSIQITDKTNSNSVLPALISPQRKVVCNRFTIEF